MGIIPSVLLWIPDRVVGLANLPVGGIVGSDRLGHINENIGLSMKGKEVGLNFLW